MKRDEVRHRWERNREYRNLAATRESDQIGRKVLDAVEALPDPYRTALLLRFRDDLPLGEVGQRLGIPAREARALVLRALDQLRTLLDEAWLGNRRARILALVPLAGVTRTPRGIPIAAVMFGLLLFAAAGIVILIYAQFRDSNTTAGRKAGATSAVDAESEEYVRLPELPVETPTREWAHEARPDHALAEYAYGIPPGMAMVGAVAADVQQVTNAQYLEFMLSGGATVITTDEGINTLRALMYEALGREPMEHELEAVYHLNRQLLERDANLPVKDRFTTALPPGLPLVTWPRAVPRSWPLGLPTERTLEHPVFGVPRADANAYAEWAGKHLSRGQEWDREFSNPFTSTPTGFRCSKYTTPASDVLEHRLRALEATGRFPAHKAFDARRAFGLERKDYDAGARYRAFVKGRSLVIGLVPAAGSEYEKNPFWQEGIQTLGLVYWSPGVKIRATDRTGRDVWLPGGEYGYVLQLTSNGRRLDLIEPGGRMAAAYLPEPPRWSPGVIHREFPGTAVIGARPGSVTLGLKMRDGILHIPLDVHFPKDRRWGWRVIDR